MSDPLSIAAGVVGILTAAAQTSSLLIDLTRSVKDAPQQARMIVTEVNDISGILSHLQSFLLGTQPSDASRTSLLMVDQVVTIVSGCVLTFSELEKILDELEVANLDLLDRIQWARKETAINKLIQRLQNHKGSLSLMLNILHGDTITEVKDSVDRLRTLIECSYQEITSRVLALELRESNQVEMDISRPEDDAATLSTITRNSQLSGEGPSNQAEADSTMPGDDAASLLAPVRHQKIDTSPLPDISDLMNSRFNDELERSWVYRRNRAFRESAFSTSTSSIYCSRWSIISGLSMAEMSTISVLNLPILSADVYNPLRSSQTWSNGRSDAAWPLPLSPSQLQAPAVVDAVVEEATNKQLSPCKGCGELLEVDRAFELAGNRWHTDCFRCNICGTIIDTDANILLLDDGSLICNNCTYSCSLCGQKIRDLAILTGDQAYCCDCFKCRSCKQKIEAGQYGRTYQGFFCMKCHYSLMERRRKKFSGKAAKESYDRKEAQLDKPFPMLPPNAPPRDGEWQ